MIFPAEAEKTDKKTFFLTSTFDFGNVFGREGVGIFSIRGQKMYLKFNFLPDGAILEQLAQTATVLWLACHRYPFSTAEKGIF